MGCDRGHVEEAIGRRPGNARLFFPLWKRGTEGDLDQASAVIARPDRAAAISPLTFQQPAIPAGAAVGSFSPHGL